jgi:hypothetical protein
MIRVWTFLKKVMGGPILHPLAHEREASRLGKYISEKGKDIGVRERRPYTEFSDNVLRDMRTNPRQVSEGVAYLRELELAFHLNPKPFYRDVLA